MHRQRQFPSARPGRFIRVSFPRLRTSCNGAIASAATDDHAKLINIEAASRLSPEDRFRLHVVIDGHEREGRIDLRIDDGDVQLVGRVDRLSIMHGGAAKRVDGELETAPRIASMSTTFRRSLT